jgi:uncharacterized metal-binding protein
MWWISVLPDAIRLDGCAMHTNAETMVKLKITMELEAGVGTLGFRLRVDTNCFEEGLFQHVAGILDRWHLVVLLHRFLSVQVT